MSADSDNFREISRGSRMRAVLTAEWVNAVQNRIRALERGENLVLEDGMSRAWCHRGVSIGVRKTKSRVRRPGICPFGEIISWMEGEVAITGIRGGVIYCGDKNFNVADWPVNLGEDGSWLVEISLTGIKCATDDDVELILPGVTTATGSPTWARKSGGGDYTDNTNPAAPGDSGTVIVPIGVLTVEGGNATLAPVSCGNVKVNQCAGILSISRV